MPSAVKEQLAIDETTIDDPEVENALEDRQRKKESLAAVKKIYDGTDEAAKGLIGRLELPEGGAVRVGRFRITRSTPPARVVSFETQPKSRVRIALLDEK